MGGSAFSSGKEPLFTPRMPPDIYTQALISTQDHLREHFEVVRSALSAPEKETYGDIDILVFGTKSSSPLKDITSQVEQAALLAQIMGAERHHIDSGNHMMHFAIPWP
jgi:hypothetical protein